MPVTKRRDLVQELEAAGLKSLGGTNHEVFAKPGFRTVVPYHREIDENLANLIRKQAGIEKKS